MVLHGIEWNDVFYAILWTNSDKFFDCVHQSMEKKQQKYSPTISNDLYNLANWAFIINNRSQIYSST